MANQATGETAPDLDAVIRLVLEGERRTASALGKEREDKLRSQISDRELELSSDSLLQMFKNCVAALPLDARPESELEEYRLFPQWEDDLKRELSDWKQELDKLEFKVPDGRLIYNNARERVLQALEAQAQEVGLVEQPTQRREPPAQEQISEIYASDSLGAGGWISFVQLGEFGKIAPTGGRSVKPRRFRDPQGKEVSVENWTDLFFKTAQWLVQEGLLAEPFTFKTMTKRRLVYSEPFHPNGQKFGWSRQLSNGLFLECKWGASDIARLSGQLLAEFGQDPSQFHIRLD